MSSSPDPKLVMVSFRLTPSEREQLDRLRGSQSRSDYIRERVLR